MSGQVARKARPRPRCNVVHVTDELHGAAKSYCKEHGLMLATWASALVMKKLRELGFEKARVA